MTRSILIALLSFFAFGLQAQFAVDNANSVLTLDGTSNVHDWTENAEQIDGTMTLVKEGTAIQSISSLSVTVPVSGLKSDKSAMDKNTFKALKGKDHPNILFNLKSAKIEGQTIVFIGTLQVAGSTKKVTIQSTYSISNAAISIKGKYACKMTDFGVEPPTALLGTMKTGDDITINFDIVFTKN